MRDEYRTLTDHDLSTLAYLPRSDIGRVFLSLVRAIHDTEDERLKRNPRITDEVRKDLRYQMGVVAGIKLVLDAPQEILELIQKGEGQ